MTNPAVRTVFICPPAAAHITLEPEPQFGKSFTRMVTKESHLSFDDVAKGMRLVPRRANNRARWTPPFALNDEQLQKVLIARAAEYVETNTGVRLAKDADWQNARFWCQVALRCQIRRATRKGVGADYRHNELAQVAALKKSGCFLSYQAACAFYSWRLNYNCVDAAAALGIMPATLRQSVGRLVRTARRLGMETFKPQASFKKMPNTREQLSAIKSANATESLLKRDPAVRAAAGKKASETNATPEMKQKRSASMRIAAHQKRKHTETLDNFDPTQHRLCSCGALLRANEKECEWALQVARVYRPDDRVAGMVS